MSAKVALILYSQGGNPEFIKASLNDNPLKYKSTTDGLSVFEVPLESVESGKNNLKLIHFFRFDVLGLTSNGGF